MFPLRTRDLVNVLLAYAVAVVLISVFLYKELVKIELPTIFDVLKPPPLAILPTLILFVLIVIADK
jgi:hypothetical protein